MLHDEYSPGCQQPGRPADNTDRHLQAISSPAIQGQVRVPTFSLGILKVAIGHIRRVRDNDVDPPVQFREHGRAGGIPAAHLDLTRHEDIRIVPSQASGGVVHLHSHDPSGGDLGGNSARNGS